MSIITNIVKQSGKKEKTDMAEAAEFLDDEIKEFSKRLDRSQAKSLKEMKITLVSDEIIEMPTDDTTTRIFLVAICKLDNKHYGAFYNLTTSQGMAEELHVGVIKGNETNIKTTRLIEDETEWHVISEFFMNNHVYEHHRIVQWMLHSNPSDFKSVVDSAKKMTWLQKVNHKLRSKHKKEITPEEIARLSLHNNWYGRK